MAGPDSIDGQPRPCQRCQEHPAVLDERTQRLCNDCFAHYVRTRPIKRIEALRGNIKLAPSNRTVSATQETPTYLLALSGGPSSLTLLHALSTHIEGMIAKTGRASYSLHAVHVHAAAPPSLDALRASFPGIPISLLPLSSALATFPLPEGLSTSLPSSDPEEQLQTLLSRPSPTGKQDLLSTLLTHSLRSFAASQTCTSILLGTSTTALSSQLLSLVAKGRGASTASLISQSASQDIPTTYAMRDLLARDSRAYIASRPELSKLLFDEPETKSKARMMKKTAIDDLASEYFAEVEQSRTGIVHNVLRTVGKLVPLSQQGEVCACCGEHEGVSENICGRCEREFGAA